MPFNRDNPVRRFTRGNVESFPPDQLGVYGLFTRGRWIYVGSGDIRERLLGHLNGDNDCIAEHRPSDWVHEVTPDYAEREKQLILELRPRCNEPSD
jgi:hypothetical protein